VEAGDYLVC